MLAFAESNPPDGKVLFERRYIVDRSDKPLGIGVQVKGTRRQADDLDVGALP